MCKFYLCNLFRAASNGEVALVRYLISRGANANARTKLGRSSLSKACWNGRVDVVEELLKDPKININD